jgi:hypothetical protein
MVTTATINLRDLANGLTSEPRVSCRMLLRKSNSVVKLRAMMVDVPAVSKVSFSYDYGHVVFLGGAIKGSRIASWLLRRKGSFRKLRFEVPKLQENIHTNRYPSDVSANIWLSIPKPYSLHNIHIAESDDRLDNYEPLVKAGLPSFKNVVAAASQLLYGEKAVSGQREPNEIYVRVAHLEAMIEKVHMHPIRATIKISGSEVSGTRLELRAEPNVYYERKLRKAGTQRVAFRDGLPEHLWVMLSKKDRWLDYREIDLKGNRSGNQRDVIIDPADITAQIEGFILRGESETVEFKQEVSNDRGTSFLRTVAAFANASGGVILLGVINGTGEVKGIDGDIRAEKDRVANMIHSTLVPQPKFRIQSCQVRNKNVVVLFINSGDSPPYGVNPNNPRYCVRRGATTQPATQEEIRRMAQRDAAEPYLPFQT